MSPYAAAEATVSRASKGTYTRSFQKPKRARTWRSRRLPRIRSVRSARQDNGPDTEGIVTGPMDYATANVSGTEPSNDVAATGSYSPNLMQ